MTEHQSILQEASAHIIRCGHCTQKSVCRSDSLTETHVAQTSQIFLHYLSVYLRKPVAVTCSLEKMLPSALPETVVPEADCNAAGAALAADREAAPIHRFNSACVP